MKKSLIAASAASVALAAMPVVGVFAALPSGASIGGTLTDTLTVTINEACTIVNNANPSAPQDGSQQALANTYAVTMSNGQVKSDIGAPAQGQEASATNTMSVSCNTSDSTKGKWALYAGGKEGSNVLTSGTAADDIVSAVRTSGDSAWAFKITGGTGATYESGYGSDFAIVPASDTKVAVGTGSTTTAFTMLYQVYIDQDQPSGSYTGGVTYTLVNPAD